MAKLTKDEWAEVRAEWEASPRQGLTWLLASAGGRWNITEEPLRKRRAAEGWAKRGDLADVVRRARAGADRIAAASARAEAEAEAAADVGESGPEVGPADEKKAGGREASPVAAPMTPVPSIDASADQAAVDLRTRLIEMHRNEWRAARKLVYEAVKEAETAKGFDKAKFAKITTESLKNIQEGERRAWSLDADLIDFEAMTDAQLEAVAKGEAAPMTDDVAADVAAYLGARIHNPRTLDRMLRANAGLRPGEMLRGRWRASAFWRARLLEWRLVSRGVFIRCYGRAAWDRLPPGSVVRDGRRAAVPLRIAAMVQV